MRAFTANRKKTTRLLRVVGSIVALGLLVLLLKNQGWSDIISAFREITFRRFLLCLMVIFISRFAVVSRWYILLNAVEDISFSRSLKITFAGLFATNFLPTTVGGDVVRFTGAVQLNINGALAAASLIVDRLVGMFGMALALPFGTTQLLAWISSGKNSQSILFQAAIFTASSKVFSKARDFIRKITRDILLWTKHPKSLILSLVFTGLHMFCFFMVIFLLLDDLGENLSLGVIGGLWSFVYFVTLLPISINGYGVQEISMAFIFNQVGGISLQSGLTISILFRTLMLIASLPGAIFIPAIITGPEIHDDVDPST
jgi:uncharacterized membrane protein YbhN (UPF0104 family)